MCYACDWEKGYAMIGGACIKTTVDNCFQAANHLRSIPYRMATNEVDFVPCQICKEGYIAKTTGECEKLDELL